MGDHTAPANAATIWTVGENLFLRVDGHTVLIPLDKCQPDIGMTGQPKAHQRGFAILIETLRRRETAAPEENKIGFAGSPVKHSLETAAANDEKYQKWVAEGGRGTRTLLKREPKILNREEGEALLKQLAMGL
jgi:hypothetical protein